MAALHDLLCDLFHGDGVAARDFVRQGDDLLVRELPSPLVGASIFVQAWIDHLEQRGSLDRALFRRLMHTYPDRADEITTMARRWSIDPGPAPPPPRRRWPWLVALLAIGGPALLILPLAFQPLPDARTIALAEVHRYFPPPPVTLPDMRPPPKPPPDPAPPAPSPPTSFKTVLNILSRASKTDRTLAACWSKLDHSDWKVGQFKFRLTRDDALRGIVVSSTSAATQGEVSSCFERGLTRVLKQRGVTRITVEATVPLSILRP